MVRIGDMGFTWSKLILLFALASFLQQSEAGSKLPPPPKKPKLNPSSGSSGPALSGSASSVVTPLGITNPPCATGSSPDVRTFDINKGQIQVCFDYTHQGAIWTYHKIDGYGLNNKQKGMVRNDNWGVDGLDDDVIQTVTTSRLYQDVYKKETHDKGASTPKEYLARGHLTPNADFATQERRDATFHFINAAPQWQYFNGGSGNWARLEKAIRKYAKDQSKTLHIITGTDGLYKDQTGDWYLTWKMNKNIKKIPVPNFFWKIVWDDSKKEGAAFVGSNHDVRGAKGPQAQGKGHPSTGGKVKTDLCKGSYNNVDQGYIWCYTIQDVFEVLPKLKKYALPLKTKIENNAQFLAL